MTDAEIVAYIRQLLAEGRGTVAKSEVMQQLEERLLREAEIMRVLRESKPSLSEEEIVHILREHAPEVWRELMQKVTDAKITRILRKHAPEVCEIKKGCIPCWRDATAGLPEDFASRLTDIVGILQLIERPVTHDTLDFALSLAYREKFCEGRGLSDKTVFRRVVESCYNGDGEIFTRRESSFSSSRCISSIPESVVSTTAGRRSRTCFRDLGIPIGAVLTFTENPCVTVEVADDISTVIYQGRRVKTSPLAQELLSVYCGRTSQHSVAGARYWLYDGETLEMRRLRLEEDGDCDNS